MSGPFRSLEYSKHAYYLVFDFEMALTDKFRSAWGCSAQQPLVRGIRANGAFRHSWGGSAAQPTPNHEPDWYLARLGSGADIAQGPPMGALALTLASFSHMPTSLASPFSSQRSSGSFAKGSVILGKYQLESLVGEGGMGAVWSALNLQLESRVAIKLLRGGPKCDELVERLKIEARAVAQLLHPGIVRVFDIGETEHGEPFIVMELLTGEGLGQVLSRGPLSCVEAIQIMLPIAEALALAHKKGIVHRDLKPDNVFISRTDEGIQPKLLDFGIAKMNGDPSEARHLTQSGTLIGSPDYMSPEQAYGSEDVDHRSDIWSFSVVLYELITRSVPFKGGNNRALLNAIVQDEPAAFPADANVDDVLANIIRSGLHKEKELRPDSIRTLGAELALWLLNQGVLRDACGASLEARWGRAQESTPFPLVSLGTSNPRTGRTRESKAEAEVTATTKPLSIRGSVSQLKIPMRGRRAWQLIALLSILGGIGIWDSLNRSSFATPANANELALRAAGFPMRRLLEAPPPSPVSAVVEVVRTAESLPLEPEAAFMPSVSRAKANRFPTTQNTLAVPPSTPKADALSDSARDLIQPY